MEETSSSNFEQMASSILLAGQQVDMKDGANYYDEVSAFTIYFKYLIILHLIS